MKIDLKNENNIISSLSYRKTVFRERIVQSLLLCKVYINAGQLSCTHQTVGHDRVAYPLKLGDSSRNPSRALNTTAQWRETDDAYTRTHARSFLGRSLFILAYYRRESYIHLSLSRMHLEECKRGETREKNSSIEKRRGDAKK